MKAQDIGHKRQASYPSGIKDRIHDFGYSFCAFSLVACAMCLVSFYGCTSEFNLATQKEESLMYGTDKEAQIGDAVAKQMEANFKVVDDMAMQQRAQKILDRIAPVSDRQDVVYTVRILDEEEYNAVSLPGGYVYIFKGLMDALPKDDEVAGVIAHEVGHITARHAIKRMQASYGYMLLQVIAISSGNSQVARGVSAFYLTAFAAYSQQDEFESDRLAVKYTSAAGYQPAAMIDVLKAIRKKYQKGPLRPISYFRTHPFVNERIAALNTIINGQMKFEDYLNLTGDRMR